MAHGCNLTEDFCPSAREISAQRQSIADLEAWQTRQNGTLQRLEDKLDSLRNWIMGAMFTSLVALIGWILAMLLKK